MADKASRLEQEEDLKALAQVILENTEEAQALTKAIQTTCDTLLRRLDEPVVPGLQGSIEEILQVVRAEKQPSPVPYPWLAGIGLGLVLLTGGLSWYRWHTPAVIHKRAALMEHVNAVLVERYATLPAEVKAKLTSVYTQQGFTLERPAGGKP